MNDRRKRVQMNRKWVLGISIYWIGLPLAVANALVHYDYSLYSDHSLAVQPKDPLDAEERRIAQIPSIPTHQRPKSPVLLKQQVTDVPEQPSLSPSRVILAKDEKHPMRKRFGASG